MKTKYHKWIITPRGRTTHYYTCSRCDDTLSARSVKEANEIKGKSCKA